MLSKSQARLFFVVTTLGFSAVFLGLTVDTIRQAPERSNEDQLTAEVIRGKDLWEANNCMGCHTILGEGAYYAPELTEVYERRGPQWIDIFLQDPQAMYPGQRKMVQYDFTAEERAEVIAFLKWVGEIDTNGFPAKPDLADGASMGKVVAASASTSAAVSAHAPPEMFTNVCQACHTVGGKGGNVGPALDGVAKRYTATELDRWLANPQAVKPGTAMPNLGLTDPVRAELTEWLMTLN